MSLAPKDLRPKVAPDVHEAVTRLAEIDGMKINEFAGQIIEDYVRRRVHAAHRDIEAARGLGISGQSRELPGIAPSRLYR